MYGHCELSPRPICSQPPELTPAQRRAAVHSSVNTMMTALPATTRATSPAAVIPVSVHSAADVSLVLGLVPRAPRLPSDVAELVAFAGTRTTRTEVLRDMIASTLAAARCAA